MKRRIIVAALGIIAAPVANAAVGLSQVPAACRTVDEVRNLLSAKMPDPEEIGKGGDSKGAKIATMLVGNGYWALLATLAPDKVCVVASGHNWTIIEPASAKSY